MAMYGLRLMEHNVGFVLKGIVVYTRSCSREMGGKEVIWDVKDQSLLYQSSLDKFCLYQ
jgi:hypothetical protein